MTREEIVEGLKLLEDNMVHFDELQNDKGEWIDVHELLFEAIQALSQEPCDDAISREELLKAIETWDKFGCDANTRLVRYQDHYIPYIHYDNVIKCIKDMPSVTQKSGKWIVHPKGIYAHLVCNRCLSTAPYDCQTNYCANCGAKMERSDKE